MGKSHKKMISKRISTFKEKVIESKARGENGPPKSRWQLQWNGESCLEIEFLIYYLIS